MKEIDRPSASMRRIARQILAMAKGDGDPLDAVATTLRAYANVRGRLSQFLGPTGFDALMSRSLAISAAKHPEFSGLRLDSNGIVMGLREYAEGRPVNEVLEGLEDLVAQLIFLVSTFIGEDLTERLTAESGPANIDVTSYTFSREDQE